MKERNHTAKASAALANGFALRQATVDVAKRLVSTHLRRQCKFQVVRIRRHLLANHRPLPTFLIIGAMRAGTSSLFKYLDSNSDTAASLRKEVAFFTRYWSRGPRWYRAHFPITHHRLAFEATPDYLVHPLAAARAAQTIPTAKLVVLLREPTARAQSHYAHMVRLGFERRSFGAALSQEDETVRRAQRFFDEPEHLEHKSFLRHSYLMRGFYARQLQAWLGYYSPDRILIVWSEDLYRKTSETLDVIADFVGISKEKFSGITRNYSKSEKVEEAPSDEYRRQTRMPDWATARLERENRQLVQLLSGRFPGVELPAWLRGHQTCESAKPTAQGVDRAVIAAGRRT